MPSEKVEDVVRHFSALATNVRSDPSLVSDTNVVKVLAGLKASLSSDGFDLSKCPTVSVGDVLLPDAVPQTSIAFQVKESRDAELVESVVGLIKGWKTRRFSHKKHTFVVISNAARLTEKRVKESIKEYILGRK